MGKRITVQRLGTRHAFALSRVVKKMDIRLDVRKGMTHEQMGVEFMLKLLGGIGDAEEEILGLFSDLSGIPAAELRDMELADFADIASQIVRKSGLSRFLARLRASMTPETGTSSSPDTEEESATS